MGASVAKVGEKIPTGIGRLEISNSFSDSPSFVSGAAVTGFVSGAAVAGFGLTGRTREAFLIRFAFCEPRADRLFARDLRGFRCCIFTADGECETRVEDF
jgi:hypothetical protein